MRALAARRQSIASDGGQQTRRHSPDYWLLIIVLGLLTVGFVVVYSISPALAADSNLQGSQYVTRQLIAVAVGLVLFGVASRIPLGFWRRMAVPLMVLAGVLTLITLFLPVNADYPAHRWIRLGGFSFQSVELLKFAIIIWFAGVLLYYAERGWDRHGAEKGFQILAGILLVVGVVVAGLQSDLGSTAVVAAILVVMASIAGMPMKRLFLILGIALIGGLLLIAGSSYRRDRIATFMNPEADCLNDGYQACQALIAVGSGGIAGLGLGNSVQAYGYLPEAENDSIFAIYAEKFGFIGVALLIGLFIALYARLRQIAERVPDDFSRLIVMGIMTWLSVQALMNVGAMLGLLPLKGITLPLISYGGSSVLMVLAALGVVFQISRYTSLGASRKRYNRYMNGGGHEGSHHGRRVRRSYHTTARSR